MNRIIIILALLSVIAFLYLDRHYHEYMVRSKIVNVKQKKDSVKNVLTDIGAAIEQTRNAKDSIQDYHKQVIEKISKEKDYHVYKIKKHKDSSEKQVDSLSKKIQILEYQLSKVQNRVFLLQAQNETLRHEANKRDTFPVVDTIRDTLRIVVPIEEKKKLRLKKRTK